MALITNYGQLKAAVSRAYLFHQRFVADYDLFTSLFETDANARLRVLPMEAINVIQTVTGFAPLPDDYLLWRSVLYIPAGIPPAPPDTEAPYADTVELDYVHPAYLTSAGVGPGRPSVFTIEGNTFRTRATADGTEDAFELHYYQKIPALAGALDGTTNWLLTEWPNAYLYGLITEAAAASRNLEMAQLYKARRDEVFAEITQRYALTTGATSPTVRTAEYY